MGIWIDHIGIACVSNETSKKFWELIGFTETGADRNIEQGVNISFMRGDAAPQPKIELLQPMGSDTPVGKFISKYGEGVQQIALGTDNIYDLISLLLEHGIRMVNEQPMTGAGNTLIAFVHPSSTGGILIEIVQKQS